MLASISSSVPAVVGGLHCLAQRLCSRLSLEVLRYINVYYYDYYLHYTVHN